MFLFGMDLIGGPQLIGVLYKTEIWSDREERFLNITFMISRGKLMTIENILGKILRSPIDFNVSLDTPHATQPKIRVRQAIGIFIESPFTAIATCFTGVSLRKRILLLCYNSVDKNYFPWDRSALSLSIFLLSLLHCFTVHIIVCSVPFIDDYLNKGQTQSIASACKINSTFNTPNQDHIVLEHSTQNCNTENVKFKKLKKKTTSYEDRYKQIHTCNCSSRDSNMTVLNGDAWLHCKLRPHAAVRTIFLIYLLTTSLIPIVARPIVAAQTSGTSDELHSTALPRPVRLFCDQYPLENWLNQNDTQDCLSNDCDPKDGYNCCEPIKMFARRDEEAQEDVEIDFSGVMSKYAASNTYSVQWSMERCKTAYKNWICSNYHRYYEDNGKGEKDVKEPCPSICTMVETSCPFFRVHDNTKLYGGQPTFLCKGFQELNLSESHDCHNMSSWVCHPNFRYDDPDHCDAKPAAMKYAADSQKSTSHAWDDKQASKFSSNSKSSASTYCFSVLLFLPLYVLLYYFLQCR